MSSPLLSIVIPTKDRQNYCFNIIKHILSLNLSKTQIVVQDNSSNEELKILLSQNSLLGKITYHYTPSLLSFVDNFNQAIELSQGEYICMIGDDDSVLPNIIEVAEYAQKNNIDAIIPELFAYFWPSETPISANYKNGYLMSKRFVGPYYRDVNPLASIKKLIRKDFQDYQRLNIPRLYHGIVRRSAINLVKDRAGAYFKGLTPDMFMSVSLCFTCHNVKSLSIPFTISGICPNSGSSASATGKHTGSLKDAPHFKGHKKYDWIKSVPYIYTVETIWAETGLQALSIMNECEYLSYYNPASLIKKLGAKYPQFNDILLKDGACYGISNTDFKKEKILASFRSLIKKVVRRIKRMFKMEQYFNFENVETISKACNIVTNKLIIKS